MKKNPKNDTDKKNDTIFTSIAIIGFILTFVLGLPLLLFNKSFAMIIGIIGIVLFFIGILWFVKNAFQ